MAKKLYAVPLKKVLALVKENNSTFKMLTKNRQYLEYVKFLGKSHFTLEIEKQIRFFHIDKDIKYALKTMESFHSKLFIDELALRLNFAQYMLKEQSIDTKEFFFGYMYLLRNFDKVLFEQFLEKLFIHYHITFNNHSNISIDFMQMAISLAKNRKLDIKESFGEKKPHKAYFKILQNDKLVIFKEGKAIKTLRKQAYKEYFYYLLDENDTGL